MCIVLLSTSHPKYPLILLNNRDEFLHRPTAPAAFWPPPYSHVLGGRDLLRDEHGTWLGITRQGRIAVLTNFREEGRPDSQPISGTRSRGALVNAWLKLPSESTETTDAFVNRLSDAAILDDVGGFTLLCGHLRKSDGGGIEPLALISNRTTGAGALTWIAGRAGEVHGLSNSAYSNPWPKVGMGEELLREEITQSASLDEEEEVLIRRLFGILSSDTLPEDGQGDDLETRMQQLRHSIFIPPLFTQDDKQGPVYATQKQTILLLRKDGDVTFVERTLFDGEVKPVHPANRDRSFHFKLDTWDDK